MEEEEEILGAVGKGEEEILGAAAGKEDEEMAAAGKEDKEMAVEGKEDGEMAATGKEEEEMADKTSAGAEVLFLFDFKNSSWSNLRCFACFLQSIECSTCPPVK